MALQLNELIKELGSPPSEFKADPVYVKEGDVLMLFFENQESYAERVDKFLTVYKSFDSDRIVGFELKGIRRVANEAVKTIDPDAEAVGVGVRWSERPTRPHLKLLLTFYMIDPEITHPGTYHDIYRRTESISGCRIPKELLQAV